MSGKPTKRTGLAKFPPAVTTDMTRVDTPPETALERMVRDPTVDPDKLLKFIELQERMAEAKARQSFDLAIAAAHGELPTLLKKSVVDFTTSKGRTNYQYEDLASVTEAVTPALSKHGLAFRWNTDSRVPGVISVTCILSHAGGHREGTTLTCQSDETGNKNAIQAIGSAVTYLQRYTLKAALGIAASVDDDDDDGRGFGPQNGDERPQRRQDSLEGDSRTAWTVESYGTHAGDKRPITTVGKDGKGKGQMGRLIAIATKAGRTDAEVKAYILATYGFSSKKQITRESYDEIIEKLESPGRLPGVNYDLHADREPGSDDAD